jgi:hypothetical protein
MQMLSVAANGAHQMTWSCIQELCINSGERLYLRGLGHVAAHLPDPQLPVMVPPPREHPVHQSVINMSV